MYESIFIDNKLQLQPFLFNSNVSIFIVLQSNVSVRPGKVFAFICCSVAIEFSQTNVGNCVLGKVIVNRLPPQSANFPVRYVLHQITFYVSVVTNLTQKSEIRIILQSNEVNSEIDIRSITFCFEQRLNCNEIVQIIRFHSSQI